MMLSGDAGPRGHTYCMIPFMSRIRKLRETEHRLVVAMGWGR